jgi:ribosomal protein S9
MGGGGGMGRGGGGRGGGGMGGDMSGMGGGNMPRAQRQSKADMLADKLKLKNEQKSEVEKILMNANEKAGAIRGQLGQQRAAIAQAMLSKASEQDLKKMFADYAAVSAQMTGLESDAFAKIYAMLKPNQQAKAAQAFELMAGMFLGNAGGGGGMGGGRGMGRSNRGGGQ